MNLILGFGRTEDDFENIERQFIQDWIDERKVKDETCNFDWYSYPDGMIEELKLALKERTDAYKEKDVEYKDAVEYPDRYSYYYTKVLHDFNTIVVVCDFWHINRRHGLSPDGWGLLRRKDTFLFEANP